MFGVVLFGLVTWGMVMLLLRFGLVLLMMMLLVGGSLWLSCHSVCAVVGFVRARIHPSCACSPPKAAQWRPACFLFDVFSDEVWAFRLPYWLLPVCRTDCVRVVHMGWWVGACVLRRPARACGWSMKRGSDLCVES